MGLRDHEIAIIGGGPGGSTLGALLANKGVDVALFEKESFPRFRIGESLLPCSMNIFRESGVFPKIDNGKYIRKYGAQFIDYRTNEQIYFNFGANPDASKTMAFEVPRADFDGDLLDHASSCGVRLYQPARVDDIRFDHKGAILTTTEGEARAKYVADASGRLAFLGNRMKMRHNNGDLINNMGVFAHYEGVKRGEGRRAGDIVIGILPNGGWAWIIPFQGKRTSVGVVSRSGEIPKGEALESYIEKSLGCCKLFEDLMVGAKRMTEVQVIANYSATCESFHGERWVALGDAAVFLDPIFSSGVHVSVSSARFASQILMRALETGRPLTEEGLGAGYEKNLRRGVTRFHSLIRLFYDTEFVKDMKKMLTLPQTCLAFTSAVGGDVWDDDNVVFKMEAL